MQGDIKIFGILMLSLFAIAMITGITYLGLDELKENVCENQVDGYTWTGSVCNNASEAPVEAVTITAITKIGIVESAVNIALGLLGLVVLIAVFMVLLKLVRGFNQGTM